MSASVRNQTLTVNEANKVLQAHALDRFVVFRERGAHVGIAINGELTPFDLRLVLTLLERIA